MRRLVLAALLCLPLSLGLPAPRAAAAACPTCGGTGRISVTCPSCGGSGVEEWVWVHGQQGAYGCTNCGGTRGNLDGTGEPGTGQVDETCPACGGTGEAGAEAARSGARALTDQVDASRRLFDQAAAELREMEQLRQELAESARARLDSLPPEERASLGAALEAVLRRTQTAAAEQQRLGLELVRQEQELGELQDRIFSARTDDQRLQEELASRREAVADLEQKLAEARQELPQARAALGELDRLLAERRTAAAEARLAYWQEVGDFFRGQELGSPRSYMTPVEPRPARTERRVEHVGGQPVPRVEPLVAMAPVALPEAAVVASWGPAFPAVPVAVSPGQPVAAPSGEELAQLLNTWAGHEAACAQLARRNETRLIESREAQQRLQESLAALAKHERERTRLGDLREELQQRLALDLWELEQRYAGAKSRVAEIGQSCQVELHWEVAKRLWRLTLRDENLANAAYAQNRLASDVLSSDLAKAAAAAADPELNRSAAGLAKSPEERGVEFLQNLFDVSPEPLEGQEWLDRVLGREYPSLWKKKDAP